MAKEKKNQHPASKRVTQQENINSESTDGEVIVIPLAREHLQVSKRQVVGGKLKLHKTVEERLETLSVPLQTESLEVVRVPKGEIVAEATSPRQEGDTLILPIYEEVVVVEKRLRLIEEVHITTKRAERNEVREVLLRQEKVRLEKDGREIALAEQTHGR